MFTPLLRLFIQRPSHLVHRAFAAPAKKKETKPNAAAASFVEEQYNRWRVKPDSVHSSWHLYFMSDPYYANGLMVTAEGVPIERPSANDIVLYQNIQSTIRSYQQRGHIVAQLDPLGIVTTPVKTVLGVKIRADKSVTRDYTHGFTSADMDRSFQLPPITFIGGKEKMMKLKDIITRLEEIYCSSMGLEYMFMTDHDQVTWLKEKFEMPGVSTFTKDEKMLIFERLTRATGFEEFLKKKYPSEKRFGLEGCEMMIPALKQIIDVTSSMGVETIVIGMAHRGRLNVLSNVCRKPLSTLLTQFSGLAATDAGSGDVKYHLGTYIERLNRVSNKNMRLALIANPSHLEAVDPVVVGRVKAEQFYQGDSTGNKAMSILIHGDASNAGQGLVYEVLHLSDLPNFETGGTIHIVANNQVGFTTDPRFSRSSRYCTDVQKVVDGPIFHVNADEPEAVIHVCNVAAQYRMKYHKDIVIDLVGYRRMGHNEIDEPMFTQPLMYQKIRKLKTCWQLYSEKLIKEGVVTKEKVKEIYDSYEKICNDAFDIAAKEKSMKYSAWIDSPWSGFFEGRDQSCSPKTGISEDTLRHIGNSFSSLPETIAANFKMHKGLERVLDARKKMVKERMADWALGEAFAFGSLMKEGTHVRLSGQDVERGTFSHRHHVIHDQTIDKLSFCSLCHLYPDQAKYSVNNSSLSESAVLGFELGFSMTNPNSLVMWEGQFGDFCNNAQVIIDQFIASGQAKWVRQAGIVMLLPHGMEGMGPEHSSCRPERFLQMCDDDPDEIGEICDPNFAHKQLQSINWIVANCSTPANLFHIFRRQVHLPFRKPLILATPKSLLRLPACRSSFDEMIDGTEFKRLIPEPNEICGAKTIVFCTGKTYYDLLEARKERGKDSEIAISRIEQICPFPYDLYTKELERFGQAQIIWAQEEHKNQGWWPYVQSRMTAISGGRCIQYVGRKAAAAPSTGSKYQHYQEVESYYSTLFGPAPPKPKDTPKEAIKDDANKKPDASKPAVEIK